MLQRSTETDELEDNEGVPQWKPDEQPHDEEAVDDEEEVPQWETPVSAQEAQEPTVPQWVPPPAERSIGVRRKITKKREPPQWYKENAEQVPYQEEEQPTEEHMPVEDEEMVPQYQEDYGQSAEAEPRDQDMEHEEYERPDLLGHGLSEADPMPDLDSKIKAGVRLAHRGLGHPANETFIRMLRLGGAPAEAISYARVWKCPTCERCKAPAHQRAAHTHTAERFNEQVGVDVIIVHDSEGKKYPALNIVDMASRYQTVVLLDKVGSEQVARAFAQHWVRWAGAPEVVQHDQGGEFQKAFEQLMETLNARTQMTSSDSAWQHGMTERHGGILKVILRHIVEEQSCIGAEEMDW